MPDGRDVAVLLRQLGDGSDRSGDEARALRDRPLQFIAFQNSFHGRTMGALSLTSSKPVQRKDSARLFRA